jgi:uncharacterized UPF0146 family protein
MLSVSSRSGPRPRTFSIEAAESWALERARELPSELFRLTAYWDVRFIRQPVPQERKTRYVVRIAQSENYGLACGLAFGVRDPDPGFVGKDVRQILAKRLCRGPLDRTAFVDLVLGHLPQLPVEYVIIDGTVRDKYLNRARIFAVEVENIIRRKGYEHLKGARANVLVIGATAGIIGALTSRGFEVSATDLSSTVVGTELAGVTVADGKVLNDELMRKADIAIITGMTLPNRSLPGLMKLARQYNTSAIIWAITGRNFGRYYIEHGVDCVISDPSPFLLLPGPARLAIHRKKIS